MLHSLYLTDTFPGTEPGNYGQTGTFLRTEGVRYVPV